MKNIKAFLALALIAVLLCGCGGNDRAEALIGTWKTVAQDTPEEAEYLMDYIELYDEEKELVDPGILNYAMVAEFTADGNYSFAYDVEGTKDCVAEFYRGVMDALYEGRAGLSELYGTDLESMTQEEFYEFYAVDIYGMDSFEALIAELAETAYDYAALEEPLESGTYKVVGFNIMCTAEGETEAEGIGFAIEGENLKLTYSDGEELYTRVK